MRQFVGVCLVPPARAKNHHKAATISCANVMGIGAYSVDPNKTTASVKF